MNFETGSARPRWILGGLLAFLALNAFGGGIYGLLGAPGVPTEWLEGSLFRTYFIPSLFLFVVMGGACAAASWAVLGGRSFAGLLSLAAGMILISWIAAQMVIIGYVSWLQPAVAGAGFLVLMLSWAIFRRSGSDR